MVTYKLSEDTIEDINELKKTFNDNRYKLLEKKEKRNGLVKIGEENGYPLYELENGSGGDNCCYNPDSDCVMINDEFELNTPDDHIEYLKEMYDETNDKLANEELYEERCALSNGVNECYNYISSIWTEIQDELSIILEMEGFKDFEPIDEISFCAYNYHLNIKVTIYSISMLDINKYEFSNIKDDD